LKVCRIAWYTAPSCHLGLPRVKYFDAHKSSFCPPLLFKLRLLQILLQSSQDSLEVQLAEQATREPLNSPLPDVSIHGFGSVSSELLPFVQPLDRLVPLFRFNRGFSFLHESQILIIALRQNGPLERMLHESQLINTWCQQYIL